MDPNCHDSFSFYDDRDSRLSLPVSHSIGIQRRQRDASREIPRSDALIFVMGPPKPPVPHGAPIYRLTATALGAGMWFWLMYRAKKDGAVLMGWKHPWDH
ncbi:hypothetical protein CCM_03935 [Cordyceps militaris CM01]|uniref:NADH dehydrogenase [ubiquinone] 1 beta subcomplex subunit 2 n=2 Tax=Cordyceps militaris TaxID=73501 RepID=G3JD87_CORMM|nr:uncharacterized protein CCM_03935 [Cordyceps militaris CM01]ATY66629.1 hypothetical protein A9K55_000884 [Cordyceps militaris]EGX92562.1 hypothetical protein CCM_03935 [Cordyceps militaris CM01]